MGIQDAKPDQHVAIDDGTVSTEGSDNGTSGLARGMLADARAAFHGTSAILISVVSSEFMDPATTPCAMTQPIARKGAALSCQA